MRMNIVAIIISILLLSTISSFAADSGGGSDPIGNSFIVNSLKMESETEPANETSEITGGEIIFDNSFDDSLIDRKDEKTLKNSNPDILRALRKKDSRWHLVEYKVRKNDSIWKIAKKFKTDSTVIISVNSLDREGTIRENDTLLVPSKSGVTHRIRKGESLSSIAGRYDVDIEMIAEHNNIDGKKIIAGRSIFIPDASEKKGTEPVREKRKAAESTRYIALNKSEKESAQSEQVYPAEKIKNGKLHLSWPLRGSITSGFGYRTHPFSGKKRFHCGLDIGADIGTPVRASGDGKVIYSGWKDQYGYLVVIQHVNNYLTVYAHNSRLLVENGETVDRGQKIALSGKTGAVTGAHLHFEIRKGIVPINPSRILK